MQMTRDKSKGLPSGRPRHPGRSVPEPELPSLRIRSGRQKSTTPARHRRQPGRIRDGHPGGRLPRMAPDPIGGIVWLAWGAQDTSCFMPLYAGITSIPRSFEIGDHWEFNRDAARWAFDYVDFHTQVVYSKAIEDVRGRPGDLGEADRRQDANDRRLRPRTSQERPGRRPQVPDGLLPRERRTRHQCLVEAGRRPAGQVQSPLDLRRQDAEAEPDDIAGLVA